MPPHVSKSEVFVVRTEKAITLKKEEPLPPREYKLVWRNIVLYIILHGSAIYGLYLMVFVAKWYSFLWAFLLNTIGCVGVTAGAHRLWSHRAYKARTPLKVILMLCQTMAFEGSVIEWCRYHRVHHKYSETDADPHSAKRGFFFSHVGWLLCRHHPDVLEKRRQLDISDLVGDPVLAFQSRHYSMLMPIMCFVLPTVLPMWLWNETFWNAWYINLFRYALTLNCTWLVNSVAHLYGRRPYDKTIYPAENLGVSIMAVGEGWHNYHHTFPWDYKTSELGKYSSNVTTAFIDAMAKIGWAYDLKSVSPEIIERRVRRTGDGSHELWGWDDENLDEEDRKSAVVTHRNCEE